MVTYTFKTNEPDLIEILESSENKSNTIKEALRQKKIHDLNPMKQEIPKLRNVRVTN